MGKDFSTTSSGTFRFFLEGTRSFTVAQQITKASTSFFFLLCFFFFLKKKEKPKVIFSNLSLRVGAKTTRFKGLPQFYY